MDFWTVALFLYLSTVLSALVCTWREQRQGGGRAPVPLMIGYGLCTVWPLVAAVMVVACRGMDPQHD